MMLLHRDFVQGKISRGYMLECNISYTEGTLNRDYSMFILLFEKLIKDSVI